MAREILIAVIFSKLRFGNNCKVSLIEYVTKIAQRIASLASWRVASSNLKATVVNRQEDRTKHVIGAPWLTSQMIAGNVYSAGVLDI